MTEITLRDLEFIMAFSGLLLGIIGGFILGRIDNREAGVKKGEAR
jgi:hypothetical protein